jgi:pimeloyl-ACP methyl ester carboxylesterase
VLIGGEVYDVGSIVATNESTKLVTLNFAGSNVTVYRTGMGPIVVCLHAVGHGARDFVRLAAELNEHCEIVTLDWPGHGESPPDGEPVTAQHYARLLASAMDVLEIRSAYLLGNSISGAVAMLYAAAHPQRVRGLILCNPAGLQPTGLVTRLVCGHMARFFGRGARGAARFPAQFRRYYERQVLPSPAAQWRREEIIARARQSAPILQQAWQSFATREADLCDLPPQILCPVFLAWAKNDRYIAWSRSKKAASGFPASKVELFDGGHSAFLEAPEQFACAFRKFIEEPRRSAATGMEQLNVGGSR